MGSFLDALALVRGSTIEARWSLSPQLCADFGLASLQAHMSIRSGPSSSPMVSIYLTTSNISCSYFCVSYLPAHFGSLFKHCLYHLFLSFSYLVPNSVNILPGLKFTHLHRHKTSCLTLTKNSSINFHFKKSSICISTTVSSLFASPSSRSSRKLALIHPQPRKILVYLIDLGSNFLFHKIYPFSSIGSQPSDTF